MGAEGWSLRLRLAASANYCFLAVDGSTCWGPAFRRYSLHPTTQSMHRGCAVQTQLLLHDLVAVWPSGRYVNSLQRVCHHIEPTFFLGEYCLAHVLSLAPWIWSCGRQK